MLLCVSAHVSLTVCLSVCLVVYAFASLNTCVFVSVSVSVIPSLFRYVSVSAWLSPALSSCLCLSIIVSIDLSCAYRFISICLQLLLINESMVLWFFWKNCAACIYIILRRLLNRKYCPSCIILTSAYRSIEEVT